MLHGSAQQQGGRKRQREFGKPLEYPEGHTVQRGHVECISCVCGGGGEGVGRGCVSYTS